MPLIACFRWQAKYSQRGSEVPRVRAAKYRRPSSTSQSYRRSSTSPTRSQTRMTRTKKLSLTDPALVQAIDEQHTLFIERFGREPTPDDPLFFCWHSTTPVPMCEM